MKIAFPGRKKLRIERKTKILYIKEVKSKKTCSWQAEGEWDEDRKMGAGFSRSIGCCGSAGRRGKTQYSAGAGVCGSSGRSRKNLAVGTRNTPKKRKQSSGPDLCATCYGAAAAGRSHSRVPSETANRCASRTTTTSLGPNEGGDIGG